MTKKQVILEGSGIGRVFGEGELAVRALHPTDIQVAAGEVLVIRGPSGSGKTTLLSILGLVLTPSEGEVIINGQPVSGSTDEMAMLRRDCVGFVFQQFNLLPSLSALQNVGLPLLIKGIPRSERAARARAALKLVDLVAKADARPRLLSGGQQQRVAIARALVTDAPVLLCDEPTASLDGVTGKSILATLRRLATNEGRAIVIVTHDDRVLSIADRLINVVDGLAQEAPLSTTDVAGRSDEPHP